MAAAAAHKASPRQAVEAPLDQSAEAVGDNAARLLADARRDNRLATFDLRVLEALAARAIVAAIGKPPPAELVEELGIERRGLERILQRLARCGYVRDDPVAPPGASSKAG
jgi:hypothetical protein